MVSACKQSLSLSPAECGSQKLTDENGWFRVRISHGLLDGVYLYYQKVGYEALDSCKTLKNGNLECYMRPHAAP
jgi:hypothetical protein